MCRGCPFSKGLRPHGRTKNRRRLVFDQVLPERNTQPSHRACLKTGDLGTSRLGHSTAHGTALLKSAAACVCVSSAVAARAHLARRACPSPSSRASLAPLLVPRPLRCSLQGSPRLAAASRRVGPCRSSPRRRPSRERASDELQTSFRRASDELQTALQRRRERRIDRRDSSISGWEAG